MIKAILVAAGLTLAGVLLSILKPAGFEIVERKLYDTHFVLRGPSPRPDRIVIVTIDEKTLQTMGRWPWPRSTIAGLFEKIVLRGARVVVPDIFFAEPTSGPEGPRIDRVLAETLHRYPNIFMGYFMLMTPEEARESSLSPGKMEENFKNLKSSALPFEAAGSALPQIQRAIGIQDTLPIFSDLPGGRRHGFFNLIGDPDGTVRSTPLLVAYRDKIFPSLALQVAMAVDPALGSGYLPSLGIDRKGELLVHFSGGGSAFPRVSALDLVKDRERVSLQDKIVVVGATAAGLVDTMPTPVDSSIPSDALMAHVIGNLLDRDFLRRDALTDLFSRGLILAAGLVLGFFLPRLKPAQGFFLFLAVELLAALAIHLFFVQFRWVLQNIYPLFSTVLVYGGTSLYGYLVQEKEKRFISDTFGRYLSGDVIRELTEHPEKVRLGGERKDLTVFFSDIRDFTTIVETTPAEVIVDFLNAYLTPVTDIIFEQQGLLDKYIGDAVMAVFGTPLPLPDHPQKACRAAVEIARLLKNSRERWEKEYQVADLRIGVGINTGVVTVGNLGSERRFDYTVVGDAVNLASRLEGLNKYYGTTILVSQGTYERVRNDFSFRELDQVRVKGKKQVLTIYELLVDPPFDPAQFLPLFQEALQGYRCGDFSRARPLFEKCLSLAPDDGPSRHFIAKCREHESEPPADWDGITTFLRK